MRRSGSIRSVDMSVDFNRFIVCILVKIVYVLMAVRCAHPNMCPPMGSSKTHVQSAKLSEYCCFKYYTVTHIHAQEGSRGLVHDVLKLSDI